MLGTLIDCYRKGDSIILWIRVGDTNLRFEDSFMPKLYVKGGDLKELKNALYKARIRSTYKKKMTFLGKETWALEIQVLPSQFHYLIRYVEKLTNYEIEIYNADVQLEEYYFFEKGLFPLARVEFEEKDGKIVSIKALDRADDIHYTIPDFSVCKFKVVTKDNLLKGFDTSIVRILFNKEVFEGEEKDVLLKFKNEFERIDPDVLWTHNGNVAIPYLSKKFKDYDISFQFNRLDEDDFEYKRGEHYHSYGRVVYRTHSIFLKGRLHFDTHSFFADDSGYFGIMDTARVCYQRIQRAHMRSAGAAVTNLLLRTAHKMNFLLPYKIGLYERFKTLEQLYNCDRGSFIFEPRVGFHTDVAEFDFVSLYPNIMNKYNLSPETLFCSCCKENKVPGLHYHFCTKVRGIVPIVAKMLISRRIEFKKENTLISKEKRDALKWLLVTMFGYQACVHRKIGIIETHESIQAYARETLLEAVRISENHDFEVMHGIIDSIYIRKKGATSSEIERLRKEIQFNTGLELNFEGRYKWIVFLPSIVDSRMPIANRFYGVFESGELKVRGIEARRKDSPKIVANMQMEILEKLSIANNEEEFRGMFPKVFATLKNYVGTLENASLNDLAIVRTISKTDYKNDVAQRVVVEQMRREGYGIEPGMTISYILRDVKNRNPYRRYASVGKFDGRIDVEKYIELMVKSVYGMLLPFGITMEEIYRKIGVEKQMSIPDYIKLENEIKIL